jgi:hypothetical protein
MCHWKRLELVRAYAAGQNASEAVKIQIGNLDGAIAAEEQRIAQGRSVVDRAYGSAIAKCDARKAEREREAKRNRQTEKERPAGHDGDGPRPDQ